MTSPNTLIFVDLMSDDPVKAGKFYADVMGWEDDVRMNGQYCRMVPGGNFKNPDGSESEIGNLHIGIGNVANLRPNPDASGVDPRSLSPQVRSSRLWVLVSEDDNVDRIMSAAVERGAETLWRNHYWKEFNGFNDAFRDPWGNEIILWRKGGADPVVPEGYTSE